MIIFLALTLSSCTMADNNIINSPVPTENGIEGQINAESSPTPSPERAAITNILIPEQELVYRNRVAGYQITFPEKWRGYYVVTEYNNGDICVGFYGKSKTGQMGEKHQYDHYGLDMFWISTPKLKDIDMALQQRKIGEINGVEYFYGQWGTPAPTLSNILKSDGLTKEFIENEYGYQLDEEELLLVKRDNEILVQIIQEDLWNAEEVIFPTFKAIE